MNSIGLMNPILGQSSPLETAHASVEPSDKFGPALQSAIGMAEETAVPASVEDVSLSGESFEKLEKLLDFLKQADLTTLVGQEDINQLMNQSSLEETVLSRIKTAVGEDGGELSDFVGSIDEFLSKMQQGLEEDEQDLIVAQSILGAGLLDLYAILKQVASLSDEEFSNLPAEGGANLLKVIKIEELAVGNKDMSQDEAAIHKQMKSLLEGLTSKIEKWMTGAQNGERPQRQPIAGNMNPGETAKQVFLRESKSNKEEISGQRLGLPMTRQNELSFAGLSAIQTSKKATLTKEVETPTEGRSLQDPLMQFPMSRLENLAMNTSKQGSAVTQEKFIQQFESILSKADFSGNNGVNKLLIRLNPEHLGTLRIELIQQDGVMTAKILASTKEAKEMLENHLHGLKQSFAGQSLPVEKVEISQAFSSLDSEKRDTGNGENRKQQEENRQDHEEEATNEFSGSFAEALLNLEV